MKRIVSGLRGRSAGPAPFVARRAADFLQAKDYLVAESKPARKHFGKWGRRDPAATCFASLLAEVEGAILSDIPAPMSGGGHSVVASILYGAIARPHKGEIRS